MKRLHLDRRNEKNVFVFTTVLATTVIDIVTVLATTVTDTVTVLATTVTKTVTVLANIVTNTFTSAIITAAPHESAVTNDITNNLIDAVTCLLQMLLLSVPPMSLPSPSSLVSCLPSERIVMKMMQAVVTR